MLFSNSMKNIPPCLSDGAPLHPLWPGVQRVQAIMASIIRVEALRDRGVKLRQLELVEVRQQLLDLVRAVDVGHGVDPVPGGGCGGAGH